LRCVPPTAILAAYHRGGLGPGMRTLFGAQNLRDFVVDGSLVDCESGGDGVRPLPDDFQMPEGFSGMGPFNWNGGMRAAFAAAMQGTTTINCR
jgi:hypothetical protein